MKIATLLTMGLVLGVSMPSMAHYCCSNKEFHPGYQQHEYTKTENCYSHTYVYPWQPDPIHERYQMPYYYYPGDFSPGRGMGVFFRYR